MGRLTTRPKLSWAGLTCLSNFLSYFSLKLFVKIIVFVHVGKLFFKTTILY